MDVNLRRRATPQPSRRSRLAAVASRPTGAGCDNGYTIATYPSVAASRPTPSTTAASSTGTRLGTLAHPQTSPSERRPVYVTALPDRQLRRIRRRAPAHAPVLVRLPGTTHTSASTVADGPVGLCLYGRDCHWAPSTASHRDGARERAVCHMRRSSSWSLRAMPCNSESRNDGISSNACMKLTRENDTNESGPTAMIVASRGAGSKSDNSPK